MSIKFSITTSRTGERSFEMARINVLLGTNGTGKSKLIEELKGKAAEILPEHTVVYIEGGRAIQMFDSLELDQRNFNHYRTLEQTFNTYKGKRAKPLNSRFFDALKTLEEMGNASYKEHSLATTTWDEGGREGKPPKKQPDPMTRVFEAFNEIFPRITLEFRSENRRLACNKNGAVYAPTGLSDGEKQVFSILVDVIELTEAESILFVDEPELNLNPGLANRLWASIESILPKTVFIYATHSVNFALRPSVDHLLLIGNDAENIQEIEGLEELTFVDRQELLGNLPNLVAHANTLVVEGHDESFDAIFYRWLLSDVDCAPAAVGGSEDVIAIAKREGKWQRISPSVRLTGVIDRDCKSDEDVKQVENDGIVVLDRHEAESYLCDPTSVVSIASAIGAVDTLPTIADVEEKIIQYLADELLQLCARRTSQKLRMKLNPTVPSKTLSKITSFGDLERVFLADTKTQREKAHKEFDEVSVRALLKEEHANLTAIVQAKDVEAALRVVPGKELLEQFVDMVGVRDVNHLARSARHHLDIQKCPAIIKLRGRLNAAIARQQEESATDSVIEEAAIVSQ